MLLDVTFCNILIMIEYIFPWQVTGNNTSPIKRAWENVHYKYSLIFVVYWWSVVMLRVSGANHFLSDVSCRGRGWFFLINIINFPLWLFSKLWYSLGFYSIEVQPQLSRRDASPSGQEPKWWYDTCIFFQQICKTRISGPYGPFILV